MYIPTGGEQRRSISWSASTQIGPNNSSIEMQVRKYVHPKKESKLMYIRMYVKIEEGEGVRRYKTFKKAFSYLF